MPLRTFEGPSVGDLLAQIRAELGSEAVILHVRQRPHGVALTAADPLTANTYKAAAPALATPRAHSRPDGEKAERKEATTIESRRLQDNSDSAGWADARVALEQTPAPSAPDQHGRRHASPHRPIPAPRPPSPTIARRATDSHPSPAPSRFGWLRLRSRAPQTRPTRPLVLAFVGPTGAGKTTTIAKLAAHPRLFGGATVGILNLDTYRVGATEQIAQHAGLSNVPVTAAHRLKDLVRARRDLRSCQVVLVDCPGRGPHLHRDTAAVSEMLDAIDPIERHLVMPVGTQPALVRRTIEHFRPLGITHLLATKVDEMPDDWILFDVAADLGLPMRWLTDGQTIPQDLRSATARLEAAASGRGGRHRVVSAGVA